ncbi:MAG: PAS domain S-box protein, partial [Acidobacteriales bacterium]|nr:PAS domain S-box protein [Terriglobales bacterium]
MFAQPHTPRNPKMLVLEDDPLDFELLKDRLVKEQIPATLVHVDTREGYTRELANHPDLIIVDNSLPTFSGAEALELRNQHCPETPFIITSGTITEQQAIEFLRNGATDYVLKGSPSKTCHALRRALTEADERAEYRRAQLRIKHSERRHRTLLESIAEISWTAAPDGSPLPPQHGWETFTGLSIDRWQEVIHPDDLPETHNAWNQSVASKSLFATDYRLRRYDGQYRWMAVRGVPVFDEAGEVVEWTGVSFDVTEQKLAEDRLRTSEQIYRATFNQSAVGIAHVAPDGTWLRVNDRICEITGYSRDELLASKFQDITHPEDLHTDVELYRKLSQNEINEYSMEKRYINKSGEIIWINLTVTMVRDAHGHPLHSISVVQDISARKKAQAQLAEQSERLQAALSSSRTGTFRWDIRTNALDWDENLDRLFGLAPGSTARSLDQFISMVHPDDRPGVISRCERCATEGADFEMEFRVIWPDGAQHWLYDRGKTFFDKDGRPAYMTGACTDITESKAAEDTIRRSEKIAAVASLASTMSHEINNPLEAVMNCVFLLRTSPELPMPLLPYAELALQELNRAAYAVTQSLRFHRQSTHPTETLISENLRYLLHVFAAKVQGTGVTVVTDFSREVPVVAYESELRQVLTNLLSNSFDAMRREGGTITVRVRKARDASGQPGV